MNTPVEEIQKLRGLLAAACKVVLGCSFQEGIDKFRSIPEVEKWYDKYLFQEKAEVAALNKKEDDGC